jgi:hypothetical protein
VKVADRTYRKTYRARDAERRLNSEINNFQRQVKTLVSGITPGNPYWTANVQSSF